MAREGWVNKTCLKAIDLYCGSGAVTEGLKSDGFQILAAVDFDPVACATYRLNHPEVRMIESDIRLVNARDLAIDLNLNPGELETLIVCAPCQPFSSQNRKREKEDPRADLILEALRFVEAFLPKLVFIENVPGLARSGPIEELSNALRSYGYYLSDPQKINAADLGVPQRRERCIMIASRNHDVAERFGRDIVPHPRRTVREAIGGLPSLASGEASSDDPLHRARCHQSIVLERLRHIPRDGGSRLSLPPELVLKCHLGKDGDFPDVYGRMKWDDVAPTLTTGCTDVTKGRFAHPDDHRAITLREAALLQSFPVTYRFHGKPSQIARQIGNAVPVGMVRSLAPYLRAAIVDTTPVSEVHRHYQAQV
ncbi:MAG: DNA cytosine methyltransferase [Dechloromonas sp.]|jgi:DNA (cytosine-5)-methyltransferase 1|nr:DNA cytosine methyltransferase [Dechloromonas sp.]